MNKNIGNQLEWFIVSAQSLDLHDGNADLHITNYKLVSNEILSKKYASEISELRWIKSEEYDAGGGPASGVLIMADGKRLDITYNWGGQNIPGSPQKSKTYTVQVLCDEQYMADYIKKIIKTEGRKETGIIYDYLKEIEPWRCLESRWRMFFRGLKRDIYYLLVGYKMRFHYFLKDTIPNDSLIRSLRNQSHKLLFLCRKRNKQ